MSTKGLSRRALIGTAAAAGAAGAASGATGRAHAAARVRPQGTTPEPPEALSFYLLAQPVRAYDSRVAHAPDGTDPETGADDTPLLRNATRSIDISYVLGRGVEPTGVPVKAAGVLLNLTVVNTAGATGYLKVWSDGVAEPAASSINWDHPSAIIANAVSTACADGYIQVKCGGAVGAATNLIIDVVGYYDTAVPPIV